MANRNRIITPTENTYVQVEDIRQGKGVIPFNKFGGNSNNDYLATLLGFTEILIQEGSITYQANANLEINPIDMGFFNDVGFNAIYVTWDRGLTVDLGGGLRVPEHIIVVERVSIGNFYVDEWHVVDCSNNSTQVSIKDTFTAEGLWQFSIYKKPEVNLFVNP